MLAHSAITDATASLAAAGRSRPLSLPDAGSRTPDRRQSMNPPVESLEVDRP